MAEELTSLVHSILQHGIRLKSRLARGETLILENEQALLKKLLLSDSEARRWPDYGGDVSAAPARIDTLGRPGSTAASGAAFLGIRYALVCWLDEIFLIDSLWDARWNESKLELALYGTNDRAWHFWEQARLAEVRPGTEALAAFFLCVMLGFRGELSDHPDQLQGWVENCRRRLLRGDSSAWVRPPERTPVTHVPPLRGREGLRRLVVSGGALMLVMIPVLAIFLIVLFIQPRDFRFRSIDFNIGKLPDVPPPTMTEAYPEEPD